jgi:transcriptional regulator with XRE-family HTH domain
MELAPHIEPVPAERISPLASLRLSRKLTIEEAAKRAALWPDQVEWLEEGRLYRFPNTDAAVMALLRYSTSLGIDHREARRVSGLPDEPPPRRPFGRWLAGGAAAALVGVLVTALVGAFGGGSSTTSAHRPTLAAPWHISVDVLNGGGDINYTRRIADRIGSFGYRIEHVTKAGRFDYKRTAVYFEPGGEALAGRLAGQLGCGTPSPLPAGSNPHRLVVIVGPPSAAC